MRLAMVGMGIFCGVVLGARYWLIDQCGGRSCAAGKSPMLLEIGWFGECVCMERAR